MNGETTLALCESVQSPTSIQDRERSARLRGALTELSLRDENVLFEQTRRLSAPDEAALSTIH